MQSQNSELNNKIEALIKSPVGVIIILFLFIIVITIIVSINQLVSKQTDADSSFIYHSTEEVDPASGETVYTDNAEPEESNDDILYLGFDKLISSGLSKDQLDLLKNIIESYAETKLDQELTRVSLKKNSVQINTTNVFIFTLVLNINKETLNITYDTTKSPATTEDVSIIFRIDDKTVWIY